ncbi:Hypothetical protein PHPALM_18198 [Phytophthora palmivora]|uniref:Uncharacterized protein n=1 Tax=Phytophthora palmivora TaxID=4796 RepID=A0A2P4XKC7_9STRA|nr:Hypothetical protein PHPALM_18198 [Phytophthora palmivora]
MTMKIAQVVNGIRVGMLEIFVVILQLPEDRLLIDGVLHTPERRQDVLERSPNDLQIQAETKEKKADRPKWPLSQVCPADPAKTSILERKKWEWNLDLEPWRIAGWEEDAMQRAKPVVLQSLVQGTVVVKQIRMNACAIIPV